ncbi:MAG: hypothetical protein NC342_06720 [Pseudoflavonifractor sp.]|nr:hypothetical protein [Alloprevotella sp.]MCM1117210.1 hypothetical protein [Pseudoflavonifractor sp.]
MKPLLLAIAASIICLVSANAAETPDTTVVQTIKTVITEGPDGTTLVTITDTQGNTTVRTLSSARSDSTLTRLTSRMESNLSIRIGSNKQSRWTATCGGFNIGFASAPGHPSELPFEMGKSWEIGWTEMIGVGFDATPSTQLRLGFGLDWRNYKMTAPDARLAIAPDGSVIPLPYPEGTRPAGSRIKVFTLQMPLMIKQKMPFKLFRQQQWIALGVIGGYSPHASMLTRYRDGEGMVKKSVNKIGHRRWTLDLMAIAGLSESVGIYLRYQPQSVLRGSAQPDFRSLSTGLIFFY